MEDNLTLGPKEGRMVGVIEEVEGRTEGLILGQIDVRIDGAEEGNIVGVEVVAMDGRIDLLIFGEADGGDDGVELGGMDGQVLENDVGS